MHPNPTYILTLSCPDRPGIVHAVSGFLAEQGFNILTSAQYGDEETHQFFMRVMVDASAAALPYERLEETWSAVAEAWQMQSAWYRSTDKTRVMLMVSNFGHCLNDLLFRWQAGSLPIEIVAVGSNHDTYRELCERYGLTYYHWPLANRDDANRAEQEAKLKRAVAEHQVDLVVLARYMQILSDDLCQFLSGRAINIHHSFLPSFKGARPYHQAYAKGVKLIGATAHYVTADLDEGPIIEQDVARVTHSMSANTLTQIGHDIEQVVLARALQSHCEHRVLINGKKTVVFP